MWIEGVGKRCESGAEGSKRKESDGCQQREVNMLLPLREVLTRRVPVHARSRLQVGSVLQLVPLVVSMSY